VKLKLLCNAAGISCPEAYFNCEIEDISTDSRKAMQNAIFVCLRGIHFDSHNYIEDAIRNGAVCVLTDRDHPKIVEREDIAFLECDDPRSALAHLWHAWYGFPCEKLKIIGVTGTNGKTSVAHMLRTILRTSWHTCGIIGTVGCETERGVIEPVTDDGLSNLTTPDPRDLYRIMATMRDEGVEYVVMEVSSHALSLGKLAPITFEAAIFTNLTPEHLDFHKTMEAYAAAKASLFQKTKVGIFNADSPYTERMLQDATCRSITCTTKEKNADYSADEIEIQSQNGVSYRLSSARSRLRISCPIAGEFTVMNSMQAAICAIELGCSPAAIKTALATMGGVKGRMERVRLGLEADFSVLIDYAHTPDALEKLLLTARDLVQKGGRTVVLFGCGGDRDRTKRAVMGGIAARLADHVIITSDNSRSEDPMQIICQIVAGIPPQKAYTVIPDRASAIRYAVENAKAGDLILLAGKGHEEYEIVGGERRPFCEGRLVKEAFRARLRAKNGEDENKGEPTV
jgi:UDP-N-acetylmuramyl-tripeptide synthetase